MKPFTVDDYVVKYQWLSNLRRTEKEDTPGLNRLTQFKFAFVQRNWCSVLVEIKDIGRKEITHEQLRQALIEGAANHDPVLGIQVAAALSIYEPETNP